MSLRQQVLMDNSSSRYGFVQGILAATHVAKTQHATVTKVVLSVSAVGTTGPPVGVHPLGVQAERWEVLKALGRVIPAARGLAAKGTLRKTDIPQPRFNTGRRSPTG